MDLALLCVVAMSDSANVFPSPEDSINSVTRGRPTALATNCGFLWENFDETSDLPYTGFILIAGL